MDKKATMKKIYKSIDKSLKKIIDKKARTYLKSLKNKPWHRLALKEYTRLTMDMLGLLKRYSKLYSSMLKDEEIVLKSKKKLSKKELEKIIEETSDKFKDDLEKFYQEKINKDIIINSALLAAKDLGIALNINILDEFTRDYLKDKKINWAKQVAETTEKRIKEILVKGFEEGLGSYDIADLIYQDNVFSYNRAEAIARTEIIGACNYTDNTMYQMDDSIIGKKWSATGDERTRLTHAYADGQIVPKDKPFIVGGYELMYPGDSSLGAPAEEVIACRCTTTAVFEGENLKSNTIYDDKDVGTVEWLKRQDEDFQLHYLKNKNKLELFRHDKLGSKDLLKNIDEIASSMAEKDGIIKEIQGNNIRMRSGATPYERIDLYHDKRQEYDKRRVFDKSGKVNYDLDLNTHRNLKRHKIAPHVHIWNDGIKEDGYKALTLEQVKTNKDIILKVYDKQYYNSYLKACEEKDENIKRDILEKLTGSWYK